MRGPRASRTRSALSVLDRVVEGLRRGVRGVARCRKSLSAMARVPGPGHSSQAPPGHYNRSRSHWRQAGGVEGARPPARADGDPEATDISISEASPSARAGTEDLLEGVSRTSLESECCRRLPHIEAWTWRGLQRFMVLFLIELSTRKGGDRRHRIGSERVVGWTRSGAT